MNAQDRPPAVIVGVDGSPHARAALAWAVDAARRRGVGLRIVHGMGMPLVMAAYAPPDRYSASEEVREAGHSLLSESAAYAASVDPDLATALVLAPEEAPGVLLNEARHGDVIAVGSRGLGAIRALMHGSVSVKASAEAPCPVVVVPEGEPRQHRGRVVVGVDGSESSRRALRFALGQARATDSSVVVVNSWEASLAGDEAASADDGRRLDGHSLHEELFDRRSEEIVAGVLAEVADEHTEELDISAVRVQADPVTALLDQGEEADLLVVGSRGRGGVAGLVMGSVSQGVLHHATMPVAVLPPSAEGAE